MTVSHAALALGLALIAGPSFAQTPAAPAAQPAPPPAPAPGPPRPFPEGAKIAYVNFQRIVSESSDGKASSAKVQALNQKKVAELNEKNKQLQANQQKLQQSGTVLSDAARGQLEKEIERQQVEIQRYTQDAQAEVQELQQDLQGEFQKKLIPIIEQVAKEKGLHLVFSQLDAGLVWADTGLDITPDVIKRFDSGGAKPGAAAAAPPKPPSQ